MSKKVASTSMQLVGFEPLSPEPFGFCTAYYALRRGSNQLFVAHPSIEGDPTSAIERFSIADPGSDYHLLPLEVDVAVKVGDPWIDVLMINGRPTVGPRIVLIDQFADAIEKGGDDYPLTLLDLVKNKPGTQRQNAVRRAHAQIESALDERAADKWAIETYFRSQVLSHVRKGISRKDTSADMLEALRNMRVGHGLFTASGIQIKIATNSNGPSRADKELAALIEDARELKTVLSELPSSLAQLSHKVRFSQSVVPNEAVVPKPALMVPIGPAAARALRSAARNVRAGRFHHHPSLRPDMIKIVEREKHWALERASFEDFGLITVIVDENDWNEANEALEEVHRSVRSQSDAPILIAPLLPTSRPSKLLALEHQLGLFDSHSGRMLLDTSFVRSPLWNESPRRSLDRRVVDHAAIASLGLLSIEGAIENVLHEVRSHPARVLAIQPMNELGRFSNAGDNYSSEAVPTSGFNSPIIDDFPIFSERSARPPRGDSPSTYRLSVRELNKNGFTKLAITALQRAVMDSRVPLGADNPGFNEHFDDDLVKEDSSAIVSVSGDRVSPDTFLVTTSSPSIDLIRAAAERGIQTVRYCDQQSMRRKLSNASQSRWQFELPDDIRPLGKPRSKYPPIFHRPNERPAAIVNSREWRRWREENPEHPFASAGREVIAIGQRGNAVGPPIIAFTHPELDQVLRSKDVELPSLKPISPFNAKRFGIESIFLDPVKPHEKGSEVFRWAIKEGRNPLMLYCLPDELTVSKGWVIFDGSKHAAAIVASDVFSIWLRGHQGGSPLMSPKFAIETVWQRFPWPPGLRPNFERSFVETRDVPGDLDKYCSLIDFPMLSNENIVALGRLRPHQIEKDLLRSINDEVLRLYGLENTRSEIDVLSELLRLSRH